jgi:hypothetical protein
MKDRRMMYAVVGLAVVLGAVVLRILVVGSPGQKPAPSAPGYYTGLMKSKGGRDTYATEDGKVGQPPANASQQNTPAGDKSSDGGKTTE